MPCRRIWSSFHQDLIITGKCGSGKSFLASALCHQACLRGFRVGYHASSRLSGTAPGQGRRQLRAELEKISKQALMIIDDFALEPLNALARLEILEDRHARASTLMVSQLPVSSWHEVIGEPTIADAICDRIVHGAHRYDPGRRFGAQAVCRACQPGPSRAAGIASRPAPRPRRDGALLRRAALRGSFHEFAAAMSTVAAATSAFGRLHGRDAPPPGRQQAARRQSRPLSGPLRACQTRGRTPEYPRKSEHYPSTPFPQRHWRRAIRHACTRTSSNNSTPALRPRSGTLQHITASLTQIIAPSMQFPQQR